MKRLITSVILIAGALASATAFADSSTYGKTRAQVRAELIQARKDGAIDVADTTYPEAALRAAAVQQACNTASTKAGAADIGGIDASRSQGGHRTAGSETATARDSIYFGQ
jgi:Domain of unknown function (DUF4148)